MKRKKVRVMREKTMDKRFGIHCIDKDDGNREKYFSYLMTNRIAFEMVGFGIVIIKGKGEFERFKEYLKKEGVEYNENVNIKTLANLPPEEARKYRKARFHKTIPL